jgi:small subunit ribosomal protein S6
MLVLTVQAAVIVLSSLACASRSLKTEGELALPDTVVRKYETVYIVRPNLDDEAVDRTVAGVEEYIKGLGGTIMSTDKKGRRRLAYEVNKMRDGFYVMTRFEAKTEVVAQVKRMMQLSEEIIRSLIVTLEDIALETSL